MRAGALGAIVVLMAALGAAGGIIPGVSSVADLEAHVHGFWATNPVSRINPPGEGLTFQFDAGALGFSDAFESDLLARLAGVTRGTVTTFPLEVHESSGDPRLRYFANAAGVVVHTSAPPDGYSVPDWVVGAYGAPGAWLGGAALDAWYAARDPARQRLRLELVATSDLPAYVAWLTNESAAISGVAGPESLLALYSNELAFVKTSRGGGGARIHVHAPPEVPWIDIYESTNLCDAKAWRLPLTLEHAVDPVFFQALVTGAAADAPLRKAYAAGLAGQDSDGDGLPDAREILLAGTDPGDEDTDDDGLRDGEELLRYDTRPGVADSDGDLFNDGYEVEQGVNPSRADELPAPSFQINAGAFFVRSTNLWLEFNAGVSATAWMGEQESETTTELSLAGAPVAYALRGAENGFRTVFARIVRAGTTSALTSASVLLDTVEPLLSVTNPVDQAVTQARWVRVEGRVTDNVSVASVRINGEWADGVESGTFRFSPVLLSPGTNRITVTASDPAGNGVTQSLVIVQDTAGDTTAPTVTIDLPYDREVAGGTTSLLATTTLPSDEGLFFQAAVDDETALLHCSAAGSTGAVEGSIVMAGTQAWIHIALEAGSNLLALTAVDAAGHTGVAQRAVFRDMNLRFAITNPAAYQLLGSTGVVVQGVADLRFTGAVMAVNGVACDLFEAGDHVEFQTRRPVPLSGALTALRGEAVLDGRVYGCDPVAAPYEIRHWRYEHVREESEHMMTCGGTIIARPNLNPYVPPHLDRRDAISHRVQSWDPDMASLAEDYASTSRYCYIPWHAYPDIQEITETNAVSDRQSWEEILAPSVVAGGQAIERRHLPNQCGMWEVAVQDTFAGEVRFIKVSATQETQTVLFQFLNLNYGRAPGAPLQPSNVTYRGQSGFWHEGRVAFVVPLELNKEYTISAADFTWPSYSYAGVLNGAPGACSGHWLTFDGFTNEVLKLDLVPDFNHDRTIDASDANQATNGNPFRFWINDDDDAGDISSGNSDVPGEGDWGPSHPDCAEVLVDGRSDLLDFFPVWLDLKPLLDLLGPALPVQYKLRQADAGVNAVYTDLTREQAGRFLTADGHTYGPTFAMDAHAAMTFDVTANGVALSTNFLGRIMEDGNKGVLMIEGARETTAPLVLEVWRSGKKLLEKELPLSIYGVEEMYRWINLRAVAGDAVVRPTNVTMPGNNPDRHCNGKHFVFVHGYNVNETGARGWAAEIFKRLYQSGSRAMFTAVTWWGDKSQIEAGDFRVTPNYYSNVKHAFTTAPPLAVQVSQLPGQKLIGAHSLGNMLVSSAIKDHGLSVDAFFLFDAAVAEESYDGTVMYRDLMRNPGWQNYSNHLWASEWHQLFDEGDGRRQLTWRNRFGNIPMAYNYYSSGEEVLNNSTGGLPFLLSAEQAWVNQEMRKGTWPPAAPGNNQGGWGHNHDYDVADYTNGYGMVLLKLRPAEQANLLTEDEVRQNPFFCHFDEEGLYGENGSELALGWPLRAAVLAEGIPALSRAMGRNSLDLFGGRNVDMMTHVFSGVWPQERLNSPEQADRWLHSDMKNIAYLFLYSMFDGVVQRGALH